MTLTLLIIDNQHQVNVSIIFNNITKESRVLTESTNDEQITVFVCTPGSLHYSFTGVFFQKATSYPDQESKREVLDDEHFPRYKRRNLHYQKLNLQQYN